MAHHVERMPPERLPWQTYSYHPVGRRDIGRPRRRWRQQFLLPRNGSTDSILEWEEEEEEEDGEDDDVLGFSAI
jgi:hypothetical protein